MKYLYAVIRMPVEVTNAGEYNVMTDRLTTTFEPCDELPPVNSENEMDGIIEQLQSALTHVPDVPQKGNTAVESTPTATEPEVKLVLQSVLDRTKKTLTFRNMRSRKHFSRKRRPVV
jgi:hypothetical protein